MTTLAQDMTRPFEIGDRNEYPVVASDIIYQGAAVGLVASSGHARPLTAGDRFGGFAESRADNSAGAAADTNVRVIERGKVQLTVTGVTATDIGQPVYATDDDTFTLSPVDGVFVGFVHRYVGSNTAVVRFDAFGYQDPYCDYAVREAITGNKTLDAQDTGKLFWVTADAATITLPAIADGLDGVMIVNGGSYGSVEVKISPNASDMILGPDITGADNKDLINTKSTAQRGSFVVLGLGDADGYTVNRIRGAWAREA